MNEIRHRAQLAVVTGAGAGLGRALAIEFGRRGITVVGLGRRMADLRSTGEQIAGGHFKAVQIDVGDYDGVAKAFADIRADIGEPTILINNAAVHPKRDLLHEAPEDFMATVSINLGGAVACTHAALKSMILSGQGRIINVGSFADVAPLPGGAGYCVSKGAMRIFSRALVAELGDRFPNIVVTTWMPGILATRMGLADGLDPAIAARWGVELAICGDAELNGAVFERDVQIVEPRSLKRRVLDKLLRRSVPLRRLMVETASLGVVPGTI